MDGDDLKPTGIADFLVQEKKERKYYETLRSLERGPFSEPLTSPSYPDSRQYSTFNDLSSRPDPFDWGNRDKVDSNGYGLGERTSSGYAPNSYLNPHQPEYQGLGPTISGASSDLFQWGKRTSIDSNGYGIGERTSSGYAPNPYLSDNQPAHPHPVSNAYGSDPYPSLQRIGSGLSMSDGYVSPDLDFMNPMKFMK